MDKKKWSLGERIKRASNRGDFAAVFMLLPAIFLLAVISIYPFCWLFRYIFYDYNGFTAYFIGFKNFTRMFQDAVFWRSVLHLSLIHISVGRVPA